MNIDTYNKYKREADDAKADADRAQGAFDQLMERLKAEYKCDNAKDARKLLDDLERKKNKAEEEFEEALKDYEKKWGKRDGGKDDEPERKKRTAD